MTDFADLKTSIAEWANRQDWSDALVTSFIRMAEQKFNQDLRIDRMVKFAENVVTCRCADLPDDWLWMRFLSVANIAAPNGFQPIHYKARDEFFRLPDKWAINFYTIEGRTVTFGGTPDDIEGIPYKMAYYGEVPVLTDDCPSWIYTKYPTLYLFAALMHADLHAVGEENQAAMLKAQVDDTISKLNMQHLVAKASGSRVNRSRPRSFG